MNEASVVILIIVAICLVFAIRKVINDKNNGCSGCSGCSKCCNSGCSSYRKLEINKNRDMKKGMNKDN